VAFVKSVLAGIAAVIGVFAIVALVMAGYLAHKFSDSWGGAVGVDVRLLWPIPGVALVVFAAGFWWEYRRAR
jgi:hypothetical protein